MRSRSPANSAASSPPVPARTSSIAARSSAASRGSSFSASARSASGSLSRESPRPRSRAIPEFSSAVASVSEADQHFELGAQAAHFARRGGDRLDLRHIPWTGGRNRRAQDWARPSPRRDRASSPRSRRSVSSEMRRHDAQQPRQQRYRRAAARRCDLDAARSTWPSAMRQHDDFARRPSSTARSNRFAAMPRRDQFDRQAGSREARRGDARRGLERAHRPRRQWRRR